MRRLICKIRGHQMEPVREVGVAPRAGGILPSLDGFVTYEPHPEGNHRACTFCRTVVRADP